MHNLDRTQLEFGQETEFGHEFGETEQFLGSILGALTGGELEVPLQESQELELASELLEVTNEQELEQFLGNVFSSVGDSVGQFVRSDTGRALGGILKGAARQALPVVGRAVGDWVRPGGGAAGARLAQQAGSLLGLELEGLSPQDQEFEAARQFVRFASAATKHATAAPRNVAPQTAARAAAVAAAQHHAPGLARALATGARTVATPTVASHAQAAAAHARAAAAHAARAATRPTPARPTAGGFARPGISPAARPTGATFARPGISPATRAWAHPGPGVRTQPGRTARTAAFVRPPTAATGAAIPGRPQYAGYRHRGYPRYRGYPWYRSYGTPGYTPPAPAPTYAAAPTYTTGPVRPWSWPAAAPAPAAYVPPPTYAAPPAYGGNGVQPQRGMAGRWERRGNVLVIFGA
jgi:hypothetical protein